MRTCWLLTFALIVAGSLMPETAWSQPDGCDPCSTGASGGLAPGTVVVQEDRMPPEAIVERAAGVYVGYKAYTGVEHRLVGKARHIATATGKVEEVPVYGSAIKHIPIIGSAAAKVAVPTRLGQAPFIGHTIESIPVAGRVVGGTPPPWLVGAVALDSYYMPKIKDCGYTESSMFTNTDFNSPPRLRHYVNYLAPLPYTHPPIYAPGTLNLNRSPNEPIRQTESTTVRIED